METTNTNAGDSNGNGDGKKATTSVELQESRTFDGSLETASSGGHDDTTDDDDGGGQEVKSQQQKQQQNGDSKISAGAAAGAGAAGVKSVAIGNSAVDPAKKQQQEQQQQPSCTSKRWLYLLIGVLVCVVVAGVGFGVGYVLVGDNKDSNSNGISTTTATTSTSSVDERDGGQVVDTDVVEASNKTAPVSPTEPPIVPTASPTTELPTKSPSKQPTMTPTSPPSKQPTRNPTSSPTEAPVPPPPPPAPTAPPPTSAAVPADTAASASNSSATTEIEDSDSSATEPEQQQDGQRPVTYIPGNLTHVQDGLLLSEGLSARILARSNSPVEYSDGRVSSQPFHVLPDAGAAFPDTRWWNEGGVVYVSNSEHLNTSLGGVGAITMDKDGNVIDYRMLLQNTTANCGGGRTPWNTWVSCEEVEFDGKIYQVDPLGERQPQEMTLGSAGGRWESFAYDVRNKDVPRFFATEDHK